MMTEADLERTDKKADASEQYVIFSHRFYIINYIVYGSIMIYSDFR